MPEVRFTTDMGDWSTIPRRMRLATVALIAGASIVGLMTGIGLLSITAGAVLLAISAIVWVLVFDRRRPWWPDEPSLPVDPVGANLAKKLALFAGLGIGAAVLGLVGVLPL